MPEVEDEAGGLDAADAMTLAPGLDAGVLIFFSLSGYLLYAPFARAHGGGRPVDIRAYALRRLLRIAPAYLVAAFAISLLWYPQLLEDPWGIASTQWGPIMVVWTLQLEIAFYILLPLVAAILALGIYPKPFTDVMHASVAQLLAQVAQSKQ